MNRRVKGIQKWRERHHCDCGGVMKTTLVRDFWALVCDRCGSSRGHIASLTVRLQA